MLLRILLIVVVLLVAACDGGDGRERGDNADAAKNESATVVASNYPLYFFAIRIAEGVADAPEIILPDIDGDPASWIPTPQQVQVLQSADVILLNGAGAESWPDLVSLDRRRLVDTSASIEDRLIPLEGSALHQHGPEGEHSHQGTAFTPWLDLNLAVQQSRAITETFVMLVPAGESRFRGNLVKLEQELVELDSRLADVFARLDGRPVLFSHPVYQYLERRYSINGESVHWEPDETPSTSDWIALQQLRQSHPASIMVWEDEPLSATRARLADAGIVSVSFRPVANSPIEGDYLSVMHSNAGQLESILSSN